MADPEVRQRPALGAVIGPIQVLRPAHGGAAVGRHQGQVVFIRHAIPGEQVMVRVTDDSARNYLRGEVSQVVQASPHRVQPVCPIAADCGGCDLQHIDPAGQLEWKTQVLAEQLAHLAQITTEVPVEAVPVAGQGPGLGWRTRMRYHRLDTPTGPVAGLRRSRSHEVIAVPAAGCAIADPRLRDPAPLDQVLAESGEPELIAAAGADTVTLSSGSVRRGPALIRERVAGADFQVADSGFWQVHPQAAELLTGVVIDALDPQPGDRAVDLYCGVGLFASALAARGAQVTGIEVSRPAIAHARLNVPNGRFHAGRVDRLLHRVKGPIDLAVLDPSRSGAGSAVIKAVSDLAPRAIAHVGCDPAAFARDLAAYQRQGWQVAQLRAFDLFGQTHHLEAFALLLR